LQAAIKALQESKPASFLQLWHSIDQALALAASMDLISAPKHKAITTLVQETAGVAPSDPTYQLHAQAIIDTMQKLLVEFTAKKADFDELFATSSAACESSIENFEAEIAKNNNAISQLDADTITQDSGHFATLSIAPARFDTAAAFRTLLTEMDAFFDVTVLGFLTPHEACRFMLSARQVAETTELSDLNPGSGDDQ